MKDHERLGCQLIEESAREIIVHWQQLLRLSDWDIELRITRGYLGPQTYGSIECDPRAKTATLNLIDPRDWPPEALTGAGVEGTIVHELFHCHMRQAGYSYDEEKEEPLVHQMERVLLALGGGQ